MTYEDFTTQVQLAVQECLNYVVDQRSNGTPNCSDLSAFYGQKLWSLRNMLEEVGEGSEQGEYAVPYPEGFTENDFIECTCEVPEK